MVGGGWGGRQEEGMPFPSRLCDASPNTGALAMPILQRANTARGAQRAASESQSQPEPSPLGFQLFAGDLMDRSGGGFVLFCWSLSPRELH